jgi:hypothetical protein
MPALEEQRSDLHETLIPPATVEKDPVWRTLMIEETEGEGHAITMKLGFIFRTLDSSGDGLLSPVAFDAVTPLSPEKPPCGRRSSPIGW